MTRFVMRSSATLVAVVSVGAIGPAWALDVVFENYDNGDCYYSNDISHKISYQSNANDTCRVYYGQDGPFVNCLYNGGSFKANSVFKATKNAQGVWTASAMVGSNYPNQPGLGGVTRVDTALILPDGDIIVGGLFQSAGGDSASINIGQYRTSGGWLYGNYFWANGEVTGLSWNSGANSVAVTGSFTQVTDGYGTLHTYTVPNSALWSPYYPYFWWP